MGDRELFLKSNPTPDELMERINRAIELYNYSRAKFSDDEVAKLRAFLSCDLYSFVSGLYKPALDDVTGTEITFGKIDGEVYLEQFNKFRSEGLSASSAEVAARKASKTNERYIEAFKNFKDSEAILNHYDKIMKMATQVLHSMSYKSN